VVEAVNPRVEAVLGLTASTNPRVEKL